MSYVPGAMKGKPTTSQTQPAVKKMLSKVMCELGWAQSGSDWYYPNPEVRPHLHCKLAVPSHTEGDGISSIAELVANSMVENLVLSSVDGSDGTGVSLIHASTNHQETAIKSFHKNFQESADQVKAETHKIIEACNSWLKDYCK